jgi:glyoxylase-like metal-dependent hydrolase (beta-lactamase superfamily II)
MVKPQQVAPDVWRFPLVPLDLVNVYLAGGILIDSGGRMGCRKLLRALEGREVSGHALTHGHLDHQGCSHAVCHHFDIPFYCGEGDRAAVESGEFSSLSPKGNRLLDFISNLLSGPVHPVARTLREGDELGGFRVVETPGHTPGHLSFWREEDGVLILGDVLFNRNPVTLRPGLREPFRFATYDPSMNRTSARKVALLEPKTVCFGHGAPLMDGGRFRDFVAALPTD